MVRIRLRYTSPTSVSGMSSTDLEFLFSVKTAVSCSTLVGVSSDLLFGEDFFVKSSTAFTCVEEVIVYSLSWLVLIFSTLDNGIAPPSRDPIAVLIAGCRFAVLVISLGCAPLVTNLRVFYYFCVVELCDLMEVV
eukprot:IDg21510t1